MMFFFFNDTATTEIYTLSLHDALPIWYSAVMSSSGSGASGACGSVLLRRGSALISSASARIVRAPSPMTCAGTRSRSEEHTSELQARQYLVCRLLLEKKKKTIS